MYSALLHAKFWRYVDKCSHGDICQICCWLWTGAKVRGYGHMLVGKGETGKIRKEMRRAHRVSWEIHHGTIPSNLWVLHNCPDGDNPLCVNPTHLWLGTPDDNQKDSMRKGRRPKGDRHGLRLHPEAVPRGEESAQARLNTQAIYAIREYGRLGYPQSQIAEGFAISRAHVSLILQRKTWRHLPEREETNFINTLGPSQRISLQGMRRSAILALGGRVDLTDAQRVQDGNLVDRVCQHGGATYR